MKFDGTVYRLGESAPVKLSELKAGESIVIVKDEDRGKSYFFDVYRPSRRRDESPIEYYRRTSCVDNRYFVKHKGRYYCNPAHCRRTWTNKKKRDTHLDMAYAILD